jgi:long-chain fatty acid transport protein
VRRAGRATCRRRTVAACAAVAIGTPGAAKASPLFDLTGGIDGPGVLQPGTIGGGASAAYFNPALLGKASPGLTIGVMTVGEQIGISLAGRPGTSFSSPAGVSNAAHADGSALSSIPLPTAQLQATHPRQGAGTGHETFFYEAAGFVAKMFDDRLALGFYGIVPDGNFTNLTAFYDDEREQYFTNSLHPELYADRLTAISVAAGLGYKVSDMLSVGLGASLALRAGVGAPTYVSNAGDLQHLLIDTNANVNVALAPNLGVSFEPSARWHFTGTVHAPEKMQLDVGFTFLLANGVQQGSTFPLVYDYMPWQIGAGAAYDIIQEPGETLTVAGTAVYGKWSDYLDRHGDAPIAQYGWYDTLTPTVGVRYTRGETTWAIDAQYKPTPVPPQTGRTNYVDNDRLGFGGGVNYAFTMGHTSLRVGAQAQAYWLLPRYQWKLPTPPEPDGQNHYPALVIDELPDDSEINGEPIAGASGLQTNNPGWPGFGSEGVVVAGGLFLTVIQ